MKAPASILLGMLTLSVMNLSAWSASGQSCGSRGMARCAAGEFCNFPQSAQCGYTDSPGRCTLRPETCAKDYRPVCGCNRRTYPNVCAANAAGVSVLTGGKCR